MLSVNIGGVAEGIGTLGRKGIEGVGETDNDIGSAIGSLFGEQKEM